MAKFYKRKRSFKKRRSFKKGRKIARISTVRRMISRTEEAHWRVIENNPVATGYNAPPDICLMNGLAKGVDRYSRIANQIFMTSLELRVAIAANSGTTTRGVNRVRLLVFLDKQPNGGFPGRDTLFANANGVYDTNTMLQPLSPDFFGKRFKLLKDVVMTVGQEGGAADYAQEKQYKFFIPLKRTRVQYYDSNNNNISDIMKNSLLVVAVADETVTGQPAVTYRSVLKWRDS